MDHFQAIKSIPLDNHKRLDIYSIAPQAMLNGEIKTLFLACTLWVSPGVAMIPFFALLPIDRSGDIDRENIMLNISSKEEVAFKTVDSTIQSNIGRLELLIRSFVDGFESTFKEMSY